MNGFRTKHRDLMHAAPNLNLNRDIDDNMIAVEFDWASSAKPMNNNANVVARFVGVDARPTSAVTHKARVSAIKRRPDGRYVVHLDGAVTRINPVPMGRAKGGIRRPWYTDQQRLRSPKTIKDL